METRKISTQEFLKLYFKVTSPEYFHFDCGDRLDQFFQCSLTLVTSCGVELQFSNISLCANTHNIENNVYLSVVPNHSCHHSVITGSYLMISHSGPDIMLKGCSLVGANAKVDSDEIFLMVLAQVLKKTPWHFGMSDALEYDLWPESDEVIISKMEQVNSSCPDQSEEEFVAHAYQYR